MGFEKVTLGRTGLKVSRLGVASFYGMKQLTEDLDALEEGPMSEEEHARMRRIGDYVHKKIHPLKDDLRAIKTIRWRGTR